MAICLRLMCRGCSVPSLLPSLLSTHEVVPMATPGSPCEGDEGGLSDVEFLESY